MTPDILPQGEQFDDDFPHEMPAEPLPPRAVFVMPEQPPRNDEAWIKTAAADCTRLAKMGVVDSAMYDISIRTAYREGMIG